MAHTPASYSRPLASPLPWGRGSRQGEGPGRSRNWGTSRPVCLWPTDELLSSNFLVTERGGCLVFSPGAFPYVLDGGSAVGDNTLEKFREETKGTGRGCGKTDGALASQCQAPRPCWAAGSKDQSSSSKQEADTPRQSHQRGNAWAHFREDSRGAPPQGSPHLGLFWAPRVPHFHGMHEKLGKQ